MFSDFIDNPFSTDLFGTHDASEDCKHCGNSTKIHDMGVCKFRECVICGLIQE